MPAALSSNPRLQIMLVVGLVAALGALLYIQVLAGGGSAEPAAQVPPAPAGAEAPGAAPPAAGEAVPPPAEAPPAEAAPAPAPAPSPEAAERLEAGEGLPGAVARAYNDGDAVVLLVHQRDGAEDRVARRAVDGLRDRDGVAVFTVPTDRISEYARITEGVDVARAPALVVLVPEQPSGQIETEVRYGYIDRAVARQAVEDALYKGREIPSYPSR